MIREMKEKSKGPSETVAPSEDFDLVPVSSGESLKKHILLGTILVLTALGSFGLGRLSFYENSKEPLEIIFPQNSQTASAVVAGVSSEVETKKEVMIEESSGFVVASKNSDKYHFPWCSGAKRIKEENKITFSSTEEARKAGYLPAGNCKGLK